MVQAALSLYERKAGPMPDKVSHTGKNVINGGSKWYSLLQQVLFLLSLINIHAMSSKYCCFSFLFLLQQKWLCLWGKFSNCMAKQHVVIWGPTKFWKGWTPSPNLWTMAPSHVKGGHWDHNRPLLYSFLSFLYKVLQMQKLVKLRGNSGDRGRGREVAWGWNHIGPRWGGSETPRYDYYTFLK